MSAALSVPWVNTVLDSLEGSDLVVVDHVLPLTLCDALRAEAAMRALQPAAIGRGSARQVNPELRRDAIDWLSPGQSDATDQFLSAMDGLRLALNQRFFMGLQEYEAHFARYPAGGFYAPHMDNFRGNSPRRITTVFYLNPEWPSEAGGELRVHRDDAAPREASSIDIAPVDNRLVVFVSEGVLHEVRPATQPRLSIAGWMRVRGE